MSNNLFLYPFYLNKEEDVVQTEITVMYFEKSEDSSCKKMYLEKSEDNENIFFVNDVDNEWDPTIHFTRIKIDTLITSPQIFFIGKHKIASDSAEIGLGVRWICRDNSIRGASKSKQGVIKKNEEIALSETELFFEPGEIKGNLELEINLYIEKPAETEEDIIYANERGMLIGSFTKYNLIFEGKGSTFPIVEADYPGHPLWWVECMWTDIAVDPFDTEYFRIVLNSAHKDYQEIEKINSGENDLLLREIYSESMLIFLCAVKDEYLQNRTLPFSEGSIASYVDYFINTFEIDITNSFQKISKNLKEIVENRI